MYLLDPHGVELMKFYFQKTGLGYDVFIYDDIADHQVTLFKVKIEKQIKLLSDSYGQMPPSLQIGYRDNRVIPALLEGLAEAGLIPKMGATEAELTATKKHLEDMRALAFEEIKPKETK